MSLALYLARVRSSDLLGRTAFDLQPALCLAVLGDGSLRFSYPHFIRVIVKTEDWCVSISNLKVAHLAYPFLSERPRFREVDDWLAIHEDHWSSRRLDRVQHNTTVALRSDWDQLRHELVVRPNG